MVTDKLVDVVVVMDKVAVEAMDKVVVVVMDKAEGVQRYSRRVNSDHV